MIKVLATRGNRRHRLAADHRQRCAPGLIQHRCDRSCSARRSRVPDCPLGAAAQEGYDRGRIGTGSKRTRDCWGRRTPDSFWCRAGAGTPNNSGIRRCRVGKISAVLSAARAVQILRTGLTPPAVEAVGIELLIVVLHVHHGRLARLVHVGKAGNGAGFFTGLRENGEQIAARMAMIAITTSNSIRVKPLRICLSKTFLLPNSN